MHLKFKISSAKFKKFYEMLWSIHYFISMKFQTILFSSRLRIKIHIIILCFIELLIQLVEILFIFEDAYKLNNLWQIKQHI